MNAVKKIIPNEVISFSGAFIPYPFLYCRPGLCFMFSKQAFLRKCNRLKHISDNQPVLTLGRSVLFALYAGSFADSIVISSRR